MWHLIDVTCELGRQSELRIKIELMHAYLLLCFWITGLFFNCLLFSMIHYVYAE